MGASGTEYTLRFESSWAAAMTKDEAMALARARNMSLRAFILSALGHEHERLRQMPLADDGPLTGEADRRAVRPVPQEPIRG